MHALLSPPLSSYPDHSSGRQALQGCEARLGDGPCASLQSTALAHFFQESPQIQKRFWSNSARCSSKSDHHSKLFFPSRLTETDQSRQLMTPPLMDEREQKSEVLRERLVEMVGRKRFDSLRKLFGAATSRSGRNVRLEDLSDLSRSLNAALRRGLAGRSLAQEYQKCRKSRALEKM